MIFNKLRMVLHRGNSNFTSDLEHLEVEVSFRQGRVAASSGDHFNPSPAMLVHHKPNPNLHLVKITLPSTFG